MARKVDESDYECDASKSYLQRSVRIYYKKLDDGVVSKKLKECFDQLVERVKVKSNIQSYDDTDSLSDCVVDLSANINVNICTQSPIKDDFEESSFVSKKRRMDNNDESLFRSAVRRIGQR